MQIPPSRDIPAYAEMGLTYAAIVSLAVDKPVCCDLAIF